MTEEPIQSRDLQQCLASLVLVETKNDMNTNDALKLWKHVWKKSIEIILVSCAVP